MYMTESIYLCNASILDCMSVCTLTLCVKSFIVQREQYQVLHARIALQVNTAGTCPPLLLALRLLLQLICGLVYVVNIVDCRFLVSVHFGVRVGTLCYCRASC